MNPKIFVGAAVAGLAVVLGGILLAGPSMIVSEDQSAPPPLSGEAQSTFQAQPLRIDLDDVSVTKISERTATIELAFEVTNPNQNAMIVQVLDYQLFETGYSETEQISGGQIGTRPEGMVEFGSNYYTLLGENSITLRDKITIRNSGNTPELWAALEDGTASWRVSGTVFYNLSSMTSGQENEVPFDFTR